MNWGMRIIMKSKLLKLFDKWFENTPIKNRSKYMLINIEAEERGVWSSAFFHAVEFCNIESVKQFIKNDVTLSDRKNWKLYKEIKTIL